LVLVMLMQLKLPPQHTCTCCFQSKRPCASTRAWLSLCGPSHDLCLSYYRYVQEAACSALAEVLEELGRMRRIDLLLPRLQVRTGRGRHGMCLTNSTV
jgi:hypothetical protein